MRLYSNGFQVTYLSSKGTLVYNSNTQHLYSDFVYKGMSHKLAHFILMSSHNPMRWMGNHKHFIILTFLSQLF